MNEREISDLTTRLFRLENRVAFLFQELGLEDKYQAEVGQVVMESGMAEIIALLRMNRKIEAIKLYRQQTGTGLAEAKAVIDRMEGMM